MTISVGLGNPQVASLQMFAFALERLRGLLAVAATGVEYCEVRLPAVQIPVDSALALVALIHVLVLSNPRLRASVD